ncbi:dihydrodipicolinate synthase family protein [Haloferacaceae archaeon DSL9]
MSLTADLRGITSPLVTPFDDGDIDDAALSDLVTHLVDGGVDGLFPCGTTGEFASLTADERVRVTETVVDAADGTGVPVLAGAGAPSVPETLAHIDAAAEVGADAAVVVPPYFHTANDPAGERRFFERVGDAASLPLFLYNIPSCTGAAIDPTTVAAAADHDAYLGVKDSGGDFAYLLRLLRETPEEFLVLQGFDNQLAPALRMGADGGINALSNVLPSVFAELFETARDDRGATLQQRGVSPLFERCLDHGFAPATKAGLVHQEVIPSDEVRPPLVAVDDAGISDAIDDALAL